MQINVYDSLPPTSKYFHAHGDLETRALHVEEGICHMDKSLHFKSSFLCFQIKNVDLSSNPNIFQFKALS